MATFVTKTHVYRCILNLSTILNLLISIMKPYVAGVVKSGVILAMVLLPPSCKGAFFIINTLRAAEN
jgi:hypothetical protein